MVTLPDAPYADSHTVLSQTGLYLQDQAKLGERWVVTLGARQDTAHSRLDDRAAGTQTRIRDRKLTRRAGVVHLDPSGWAPYLSYAVAYAWTPKADVTASDNPAEVGRQNTPVSRHRLSVWDDYRW